MVPWNSWRRVVQIAYYSFFCFFCFLACFLGCLGGKARENEWNCRPFKLLGLPSFWVTRLDPKLPRSPGRWALEVQQTLPANVGTLEPVVETLQCFGEKPMGVGGVGWLVWGVYKPSNGWKASKRFDVSLPDPPQHFWLTIVSFNGRKGKTWSISSLCDIESLSEGPMQTSSWLAPRMQKQLGFLPRRGFFEKSFAAFVRTSVKPYQGPQVPVDFLLQNKASIE